jgi:hypothetical protein
MQLLADFSIAWRRVHRNSRIRVSETKEVVRQSCPAGSDQNRMQASEHNIERTGPEHYPVIRLFAFLHRAAPNSGPSREVLRFTVNDRVRGSFHLLHRVFPVQQVATGRDPVRRYPMTHPCLNHDDAVCVGPPAQVARRTPAAPVARRKSGKRHRSLGVHAPSGADSLRRTCARPTDGEHLAHASPSSGTSLASDRAAVIYYQMSRPRSPAHFRVGSAATKGEAMSSQYPRSNGAAWARRAVEGPFVTAHSFAAADDTLLLSPLEGPPLDAGVFAYFAAESTACCVSQSCCASQSACAVGEPEFDRRTGRMRPAGRRLWPVAVS